MTGRVRLLLVALITTVVICGTGVVWASNPPEVGLASTSQRAALEVSAVVSPSCTLRTAADGGATLLSLACGRSAMPARFNPRTELVSSNGSAVSASGMLSPSAQTSVFSIHF
jgi:hypothetical protein